MTYLKQNTFYEKEEIVQETSPIAQDNFSTSWIDVNYSEIQYVPSHFSSYVCYEFSVFLRNITDNKGNIFFKLQYSDNNGSSWNDWGENTEVFIGSDSTNIRRIGLCTVKFFLETSSSGDRIFWKNNRHLRLLGKRTGPISLNDLGSFYDSGGSNSNTPHYYYPTVKCYSIEG